MTYLNDVMDCNPLAFRDFFNTVGLLALQPKSFIPRLNHSRELVFLVFQAKRISKLEGAFGAACGCGLQVTVLCVVGSGHRTIILSPLQSPDMVFGLVRSMMSMIPRIVQSRTFHYRSVPDFRVW